MASTGGSTARPLSSTPMQKLLLLLLVAVVAATTVVRAAAAAETVAEKCATEITKLMDCLAYAKGQAEAPTEKCCGSAGEIRAKDPACLCYVIQQTREGRLKEVGLQLGRMVQLPAACKLPNTNVSDCPRLLAIKPSSPDYAIFNGSASANTPDSAGFMNQVQYTYAISYAIASAIGLSVFSS